jgi:hypothetical protein
MSFISNILGMVTMFAMPLIETEVRKEELRNQWEKTKTMPRKKKKRIRKELLSKWELLNLSIF